MDSQDSASPTPASQEELDRQEAIRISDGEAASNDAVPRPTPPSETPDCVPDSTIALTNAEPSVVIYRAPTSEEPDEPTVPEMTSPGEGGRLASGGSDSGSVDGDIDTGVGDGHDGPSPDEPPTPQETPPADIIPAADPVVDSPTIHFGVRLTGYNVFRATVTVYPVAETDGATGQPLATFVTSKTTVTWDELFPTQKPESGAYFYDITVEGINDPAKAATEPGQVMGLDGEGKKTRWLDPGVIVKSVQTQVLDDDSAEPDGHTQVEVTFQLSDSRWAGDKLFVQPVSPQLVPLEVTPLESLGGGQYRGVVTRDIDSIEKMGQYLFLIAGKGQKGAIIPAKKKKALQIEVGGYAIGFDMLDAGQNPVNGVDGKRRPLAGSYAYFAAFLRLKTPGSSTWAWFGYDATNSTILNRMEWIGGFTPQGYPSVAKALPNGWQTALGLKVEWRRFANEIIDQQDDNRGSNGGKYRWYGFKDPVVVGTGLSNAQQVDAGVSWWGARIICNGFPTIKNVKNGRLKFGRWIYQFPTDQIPTDQNKAANLYLAGKSHLNRVQTGYNGARGGRKTQTLWLPDPSATSSSTWRGLIVGRGITLLPASTFAADDPFPPFRIGDAAARQQARQQQADMHSEILSQGMSFLGTPYGWGGQDYGGLQSRTSSLVKGNVTYSLRPVSPALDVLETVGDSHKVIEESPLGYRTGFGIDCSGFIIEAAHLAGLRGQDFNGDGSGTGALRETPDAKNVWGYESATKIAQTGAKEFVRPGDFIVWTGHIVYVYRPRFTEAEDGQFVLQSFDTLEANPVVRPGNERGRTRFYNRTLEELVGNKSLARRWNPQ